MQALARWLEIVKPGGYVIITVPDEDLYEKGVWPSHFNTDHKVSFTIGKPHGEGRLRNSFNVLDLVQAMLPVASCERIELIREFYDDTQPDVDQTATGLAECAIEIVLKKRAVPAASALINEAAYADNIQTSFTACRLAMDLYPYNFEVYRQAMGQALRWDKPEEGDNIWPQAAEHLPNEADAHLYHCHHEIASGRLQHGFQLREALLSHATWQRRTTVQPPAHIPAWTGQALAGKSIVIWSEWGLGDEIFFFRFCRILREQGGAARVIALCLPPLLELFAASGEADAVVAADRSADLPQTDYWVYPHAIPAWLPLAYEALPVRVPYLFVPQEKSAVPPALQTGALKVGVVFKGAPNHENDGQRSLPALSVLDSLFDLPGVEFFCLQKGQGSAEAAQYATQRKNFHDLGPGLETIMQTAAVVARLDITLTIDTSIAHLAGAMGKPVWLLLPMYCDWRWYYHREDSPWYPTMRLFRKGYGDLYDWSEVVARVRAELMARRLG
jgi:hypothetical protein